MGLAHNLERAVGIFRKVIDQTVRRVIKGEKVPASEKVVSFFEEHTGIIVSYNLLVLARIRLAQA